MNCYDPIEYLYMRKPFPIKNLPPFEPKSVVKEIEHNYMDQAIIDVKKAVQKMERVMQEKKDMEQKWIFFNFEKNV